MISISHLDEKSRVLFGRDKDAISYVFNNKDLIESIKVSGESGEKLLLYILNKTTKDDQFNPPLVEYSDLSESLEAKLKSIIDLVTVEMEKRYRR